MNFTHLSGIQKACSKQTSTNISPLSQLKCSSNQATRKGVATTKSQPAGTIPFGGKTLKHKQLSLANILLPTQFSKTKPVSARKQEATTCSLVSGSTIGTSKVNY